MPGVQLRASGIRQSEISRIESGDVNPTLKTIGALARAWSRDPPHNRLTVGAA
jgi:predicted transcriptional regulator